MKFYSHSVAGDLPIILAIYLLSLFSAPFSMEMIFPICVVIIRVNLRKMAIALYFVVMSITAISMYFYKSVYEIVVNLSLIPYIIHNPNFTSENINNVGIASFIASVFASVVIVIHRYELFSIKRNRKPGYLYSVILFPLFFAFLTSFKWHYLIHYLNINLPAGRYGIVIYSTNQTNYNIVIFMFASSVVAGLLLAALVLSVIYRKQRAES